MVGKMKAVSQASFIFAVKYESRLTLMMSCKPDSAGLYLSAKSNELLDDKFAPSFSQAHFVLQGA